MPVKPPAGGVCSSGSAACCILSAALPVLSVFLMFHCHTFHTKNSLTLLHMTYYLCSTEPSRLLHIP